MDIPKLFAEAAGLTVFIFAAVAQLKQFGLMGKWLTGSAYIVGVGVGGAYRYFVYVHAAPLDWFWLVMFGAACGFIATGVYKGAESVTGKPLGITSKVIYAGGFDASAISRAIEKLQPIKTNTITEDQSVGVLDEISNRPMTPQERAPYDNIRAAGNGEVKP